MEIFVLWLEAFITLAIFSFLYKDNPVYHMVESVFAGLSAGYYIGLRIPVTKTQTNVLKHTHRDT